MNHTTLIDVATLAAHADRPDWCLVDCRFNLMEPGRGREQYLAGHLPGAVYADLDRDLSGPAGPTTGRHPLPDPERLAEVFSTWGIDRDVQVVAYDADGGAIAARLWWLLRYLGQPRVALLDGGIAAWQQAGYPLETSTPLPRRRHFTGRPDDRMVASTREVERGGTLLLVDARSGERYRGEAEPIDPVAGHIPGALSLPLQGNLERDGRLLPAAALRERYRAALGDREPGTVVHYCGSGVSACHNLLAMEQAGLPGSRLYVGSWSEWIRDPGRPIATGLA